MKRILKGIAIKHVPVLIVFFAGISQLSAQESPLGRGAELFPYPYRKFSFISPRYDRVNHDNDGYFDSYYLRTVLTWHQRSHVRIDLPLANTNMTPDGKNDFGLSDISVRYTQILYEKNRTFWGYALKVVAPTASEASLGAGKWQAHPGLGFVNFMKDSKGSISVAAEYRFSFAGDNNRSDISILAFVPNIDWWFKKWYVGYYATWTYDFESDKLDIPLDVEAGYNITPNLVFSGEFILPLLNDPAYRNEFSLKLRYNILHGK